MYFSANKCEYAILKNSIGFLIVTIYKVYNVGGRFFETKIVQVRRISIYFTILNI
jgi:hypothetical protein